MRIEIKEAEVLETTLRPELDLIHPTYHRRFRRLRGEHFRLLKRISLLLRKKRFLDLGTRAGASAICLGANRANQVLSLDITDAPRAETPFKWETHPNITFQVKDAASLPPPFYNDFQVVLIDVNANGKVERQVFENLLRSSFSGLVIFDDITYHRFPGLQTFWNSIASPKTIVPYAHHSGTGLVPIGMELIVDGEDLSTERR